MRGDRRGGRGSRGGRGGQRMRHTDPSSLADPAMSSQIPSL